MWRGKWFLQTFRHAFSCVLKSYCKSLVFDLLFPLNWMVFQHSRRYYTDSVNSIYLKLLYRILQSNLTQCDHTMASLGYNSTYSSTEGFTIFIANKSISGVYMCSIKNNSRKSFFKIDAGNFGCSNSYTYRTFTF